jgi:hypothetical protein
MSTKYTLVKAVSVLFSLLKLEVTIYHLFIA